MCVVSKANLSVCLSVSLSLSLLSVPPELDCFVLILVCVCFVSVVCLFQLTTRENNCKLYTSHSFYSLICCVLNQVWFRFNDFLSSPLPLLRLSFFSSDWQQYVNDDWEWQQCVRRWGLAAFWLHFILYSFCFPLFIFSFSRLDFCVLFLLLQARLLAGLKCYSCELSYSLVKQAVVIVDEVDETDEIASLE